MRNRILHLTRTSIPYVKELQPLTGSVSGCILMQQLDYWFERQPLGFWKFLQPCPGQDKYKEGDSWCEELGMSVDEFRTAFDKIGLRHKSKASYDAASDKFKGKYYCSYLDRRQNLTFYFRNHELLDAELDSLVFTKNPASTPPIENAASAQVTVTRESKATVNGDCQFTGNAKSPVTGSALFQSPEAGNPCSQETGISNLLNTEITVPETNQIPPLLPTDRNQPSDTASGSGIVDLIYPHGLSPSEQQVIEGMISAGEISVGLQQQLLDELAGAIKLKVIKRGVVPYTRGVIKAALSGKFTPSLGIPVSDARKKAQEQQAKDLLATHVFKCDPASMKKGEAVVTAVRSRMNRTGDVLTLNKA